jgi:hypothetical protein
MTLTAPRHCLAAPASAAAGACALCTAATATCLLIQTPSSEAAMHNDHYFLAARAHQRVADLQTAAVRPDPNRRRDRRVRWRSLEVTTVPRLARAVRTSP